MSFMTAIRNIPSRAAEVRTRVAQRVTAFPKLEAALAATAVAGALGAGLAGYSAARSSGGPSPLLCLAEQEGLYAPAVPKTTWVAAGGPPGIWVIKAPPPGDRWDPCGPPPPYIGY